MKKSGRSKKRDQEALKLERLTAALAKGSPQAVRIHAAIEGLKVKRVHDAGGTAYLLYDNEVLLIDGVETTNLLYLTAKQKCGLIPSPTVIRSVINMLRAEAADRKVPAVRIYQRWAHIDGKVYYDLGGSKRRVVEITKEGWSTIPAPPAIQFHRTAGYKEQVEPVQGGTLDKLRPLVNLIDEEWILFKAALLSAAQADNLPRPIIVSRGEQDSGKTTISRIMSELIDPRTVTGRSAPKSYRDLLAAMASTFLLVLDNVSWLDIEMCDALCMCATGRGLALSTRTLYTTAGETQIKALRPVIMNGIPDIGATQPDFLDRLIKLKPFAISDEQRISEETFWTRFEEMQPQVLGTLFSAVSMALRRKPEIEQTRRDLAGLRFVDFVYWVVAAAPALGFTDEEFIQAFQNNRAQRDQAALENSVIYPALMQYLETLEGNKGEDGTMSELFQRVTDAKRSLNGTNYIDQQENWPKTPGTFGAAIRRIAPSLRKIGVSVSSKTVRGKDLHSIDASKYFGDLRDQEQREKKRLRDQAKLDKKRKLNSNNSDKPDKTAESP